MAISLNKINTDYERTLTSLGFDVTPTNRGLFAGGANTITGSKLGTNVNLMTGLTNVDIALQNTDDNAVRQDRATPQSIASQLSIAGEVTTTSSVTVGTTLTVNGNLIVGGTTTTVNSTEVVVDDPVMTLGGDAPTSVDTFDRGIEFKYHNGSSVHSGFFGWDRSEATPVFTFIPDATKFNETYTGAYGDVKFNDGTFNSVTATAFNGPISGNADTATQLENALTLNFDGAYVNGSSTFTGNEGTVNVTLTALQADQWTNAIDIDFSQGGTNQYLIGAVSFNGSTNKAPSIQVKAADAWLNARTVTYAGDLSGNFSIKGDADVTATVTVPELLNKANISGDSAQAFSTSVLTVGTTSAWTVEEDASGNVLIKKSGTTLFKLDASGNMNIAGDMTINDAGL